MTRKAIATCLVLAALLYAQAPVDRFLHNRPFTLQEILIAAGSVAPVRLRTAIENRGVDFEATSATLDQLKTAGATPDILDLIKRVAPVPKPPPPPPPDRTPPPPPAPKKGSLSVECDPPECEVSVNGKARGRTVEGKLIVPELIAGKYFIDVAKSGYLSQQAPAVVEPDRTAHSLVRLTPDARTRELLGARMMVKMLESMGGEAAFKKAERITAHGILTLSDQTGRRSEWAVTARLAPPNSVFLENLKSGNTSAWISIEGETAPRTSRKFEQIPDAVGLQHAARMLRSLHPFALIGRIEKDKTRLLASHPRVLNFRAEIEKDAYEIAVSQELLPLRIKYQPPAMREPTMEVLYSGYDMKAAVPYPADIEIHGAGRPLVITFHFNSVSFDPTLNRK